MKTLAENGVLAEKGISDYKQTNSAKGLIIREVDFSLLPSELEMISDAILVGKATYQIDVTLTPNTLMKAVRAIMVIQRLEPLGVVVKVLPSIEELETNEAEKFSLLFITNESPEEIRADIGEVSEILDTQVFNYAVSDSLFIINQGNYTQQESDSSIEQQETTIKRTDIVDNANVQQVQTNTPLGSDQAVESASNQVHTIRVDTVRMDNLINLVGEMVITRTRLVKIGEDLQTQDQSNTLIGSLNETNVYLGRLMSDLQESVMKLQIGRAHV